MEALKNITPPKNKGNIESLTAEDVKKAVCEYYGLTIQQLVGNSNAKNVTTPRFIAIYLCRTLLNMTFEDIGAAFGNRDHTTVMNACIKIEELANENNAYKLVIHNFQQLLTK